LALQIGSLIYLQSVSRPIYTSDQSHLFPFLYNPGLLRLRC